MSLSANVQPLRLEYQQPSFIAEVGVAVAYGLICWQVLILRSVVL
ncbi:conserved protein of unknown function [Limnospira indica PCC 8005]|uniref:Uncharacterized protein n=1 Tax=Limnospira indica PCC 8005 TaxID=376219 RepID=A0A9P1KFW1_9CYAN|nr:conserved protein of unknown function [Limnospira indica PCC 8005]